MWNNSFFKQTEEMRHDSIMFFFSFKVLLTEPKEVFRWLPAELRGRLPLPCTPPAHTSHVGPHPRPASPSRPASSACSSTLTVSPQMGAVVGSEVTDVTALAFWFFVSSDVVFLGRGGGGWVRGRMSCLPLAPPGLTVHKSEQSVDKE